MKRITILLAAAWLWPYAGAFPQTMFERIFRGFAGSEESWGSCVAQTADQGYVICARTMTQGQGGFLLIRTTASGDTLMTRHFDGYASSMTYNPDGGWTVIGSLNGQLMMLRTDAGFETQWLKTTGMTSSVGKTVVSAGDGGYVFAGEHSYNVNMSKRLFAVRTDSAGDTLWTRYMGWHDRDFNVRSVLAAPDGGFVFSGYVRPWPGGESSVFLLKLSSSGDSVWMKTYRRSTYSYGYAALPADNGGYMLAAIDHHPNETVHLWLVRTDGNGDTLCTRAYPCISDPGVLSAAVAATGGFLIAGMQVIDLVSSDVCLIRVDDDGDTLWTRRVGTADDELAMSVNATADAGFVLTGLSGWYPALPFGIYFAKTDSLGNYYPLGTENRTSADGLRVAPNPFSASFRVWFQEDPVKLELLDLNGKVVWEAAPRGPSVSPLSVSPAGLRAGVYFLRITTGRTTQVKMLIKSA